MIRRNTHLSTQRNILARCCSRMRKRKLERRYDTGESLHPRVFSLINKQTSRIKRLRDQRGSNVCRDTAGTFSSDPSNGYYSRSLSFGTGRRHWNRRVASREKESEKQNKEKKKERKREEKRKEENRHEGEHRLDCRNHVRPWEGKIEGIKLVTFGIKVAETHGQNEDRDKILQMDPFGLFRRKSRRVVIRIKEWICKD